mmetsp:Transcript_34131/g.59567  ORF Transcript_34131/g.59567 Transcript_34131/m.59567 type:complete len:215 (+) Transcript_34131:720-1364(+)
MSQRLSRGPLLGRFKICTRKSKLKSTNLNHNLRSSLWWLKRLTAGRLSLFPLLENLLAASLPRDKKSTFLNIEANPLCSLLSLLRNNPQPQFIVKSLLLQLLMFRLQLNRLNTKLPLLNISSLLRLITLLSLLKHLLSLHTKHLLSLIVRSLPLPLSLPCNPHCLLAKFLTALQQAQLRGHKPQEAQLQEEVIHQEMTIAKKETGQSQCHALHR